MSKYSSPTTPKYFKDTSMPRRAVGMMMQKASSKGKSVPNSEDIGNSGLEWLGEQRIEDIARNPELRKEYLRLTPDALSSLQYTARQLNALKNPVPEMKRRTDAVNELIKAIQNDMTPPAGGSPSTSSRGTTRRGRIGTARPTAKGYVDPGQFGYDFRGLSRLSDTDLAALATDSKLREDFFAKNPNIVGALRRTAGEASSRSRRVRNGAPDTGISERRYNAINSLVESMRMKPVSRPAPRIPAKRGSTLSWEFVDPVNSPRMRVIQPDNFGAREQLGQWRLQREQRKLTGKAYVPTETYQRQIKDIDQKIGQLQTQAQGSSAQTARDIDKDIDALKFERQRLQGKVRNREQMFVREKLPTISSMQSRVRSLDKQIVDLQDELRVSSGNVADDVQREMRELESRRIATQQELDAAKKNPWYVKNQGKEVLRMRPETGVSIKSPEQQGFGGRAYVASRRDRLGLFNEVMDASRSSRSATVASSPVVSATNVDMTQEKFSPDAGSSTPPRGATVAGTTPRPRGRPRKNVVSTSVPATAIASSSVPSSRLIEVDGRTYEMTGNKFTPRSSSAPLSIDEDEFMRYQTASAPRSTTKPVFGVGSAEKPVMAVIPTTSIAPKAKGITTMPKDDDLLMRLLGVEATSGRAPSRRTARVAPMSKDDELLMRLLSESGAPTGTSTPSRRASVSVTVPASPVSYEDAPFIRAGRSATTPVAPTTRRARLRIVSAAGSRARVSTAAPVTVDTRSSVSAPATAPTSKPPTARIFAPSFGGKPATVIDVMDDADDFVPPRPSKGAYTSWSDVKDTFNRGVKAPLSTWNHPKNKGLSNKLNTLGAAREGWQKTMEVAGDTIPGRVTRQAVRPVKWAGGKIKNAPRSVKFGLGLLALGGALKWADNNVFNNLPRAKENPTTNASDVFNVNKRMSKRMAKSAYANTMMKQSTRIKKSTPTPPASRNVNRKSAQRLTFDGIKVSNKYF